MTAARRSTSSCLLCGEFLSWALEAAFSNVSTADDMVYMASVDLCFGIGFGSKIEENAAADDSGGIGMVTDMGLCNEKKFDMWTSRPLLARRLSTAKHEGPYQRHASGSSWVHLAS